MKPTKKQIWAVKETITQWRWYRANPFKTKEDYPPLANKKIQDHCYLCHHIHCRSPYKKLCPLNTRQLNCGNPDSPFCIWSFPNDSITIKKQCDRIINACKRWLKKYDK